MRTLLLYSASTIIGLISATLLFLSFLAAYTETLMMPVSVDIYAFFRSFCHQMPSRCLWYANSNYAMCSHCFGIFAGLAAASLAIFANRGFLAMSWKKTGLVFLLLVLPFSIDVIITYMNDNAINPHAVRVVSGAMAGAGAGLLLYRTFAINLITKKQEALK